MGDLSSHFSRSEFRCHHCRCLSATPQLLEILENLRQLTLGNPLTIVSGFRCEPHNKAVGGASASRHLFGDAADIPAGYATYEKARAAGAVGVGMSGSWVVHVDWRPGPPVRWSYT